MPLDVLITTLHDLHLRKKFDKVDTRSKMQLANLNSKFHGVKILRDIIDCAIGVRFYPPPGSEYYKLICLDRFHGSTCHQTPSNDKHIKNDEKRVLLYV